MQTPTQVTRRILAWLAVLGGSGCEFQLSSLELSGPWRRHTIDDTSGGADGVRTGDANHDGLTDLVAAWEGSGEVKVYLHPGPANAARRWPSVRVGRVPSVEDAVFADLDGDGGLDVVSCAEGRTRTIFVHWAPAETARLLDPSAWTTQALPASEGARQWMFALPVQIDDARSIDIVAGSKEEGGKVGWFEAPDDPRRLEQWRWHPIADSAWTMSLLAADMDGDGDQDILSSDRKGSQRGVTWFVNPGPGPTQRLPWVAVRVIGTTDEAMFLDRGDLDGDGVQDLALATNQRRLLLFQCDSADCATHRRATLAIPSSAGTGKAVRIADLDLDGRNELLFSCENAGGRIGVGRLSWTTNPSQPVWRFTPISSNQGSKFDLLQVLDLDADGDPDVVTTEEGDGLGVVWYENPAVGEDRTEG